MSANWSQTTLGEVITLQRGFDLTEREAKPGPYPVFSSGGCSYTTDVPKIEGPGVITGRKGVLGKVHYSPGPYWPHDTTLWVKDFKGAVPRFIYYLLKTLPLASLDAGASNPTLNRNHAHLLPVTIPDTPVQASIAGLLGSLDDLIDNSLRRVAVVEGIARAVYREWFSNFRFPGYRSATFVGSPIGLVPDGWVLTPASRLLMINPRIRLERSKAHPFMAMADLDEQTMICAPSAHRDGSSGSKYKNGDTLFARITPCLENGKTGFVQCLQDDEVGLGSTEFMVLRGQMVGPAYTYCLARSDEFRGHAIASMSGASGRQRVRNECFETLLLATPPKAIADSFEAIALPMFQAAQILREQSARLSAIQGLLLPKLVTGQVDVSALDLGSLVESAVA